MNDQNKYIWIDSQLAYIAVLSARASGELHARNGQSAGADVGNKLD